MTALDNKGLELECVSDDSSKQ